MTEKQKLDKLIALRSVNNDSVDDIIKKREEINRNKQEWLNFWRRNINLYISHKLGVNTYPFQHKSYYLMDESTTYVEIATRGLSKTFRMALWGCATASVRPYTKIVLTASTFAQASALVFEKLEKELFTKETLSPVLSYLYKEDLIVIKKLDQKIEISFTYNGSTIIVVPCMDSVRGLRCNILMFEECRLMKKSMIDSVFENMLQPRTAGFLALPEYIGKEEYVEDVKSIYITSNRFKNEWFYRLFKKTFSGYFLDQNNKDRVFAGDIYLALKYGLKTKKWFLSKKRTMNELDFKMEVLNEALGEAEGAYFSLDLFSKNQVIKRAFRAPNTEEFTSKKTKNREKSPEEIRLLFVDFAFTDSTKSSENDNTVIGCMSLYNKNEKLYRSVDYIETRDGGKNDYSLRRIRELFWDYEADYIVLDLRNGGELNFNDLTKEFKHPERSENEWNSCGFTICEDRSIHMTTESKLAGLKERTVDSNAIPVIIPIIADKGFNSLMWMDLKKRLQNEEISFLVDDLEFKQEFEVSKECFDLTNEEKASIQMPYIQTMLLINEAVSLVQSWNNGNVALSETGRNTKDRIVGLAYGNYIATLLEHKIIKENQQFEADYSDYKFVY